MAFLDNRPLFPGHVLLVTLEHHVTLGELPERMFEPLFRNAQRLARAVERAMDAHGTLVLMNNTVSQSVPHLHVHVIPRRRKDGLRGFLWPRRPYKDAAHARATADAIRSALEAEAL